MRIRIGIRLFTFLGLLLAVLMLRPAPAESGSMTVCLVPVDWTDQVPVIDANGNVVRDAAGKVVTRPVARSGVKAGLNLTVLFIGPVAWNGRFPRSMMELYEPIFERVAAILYDATEGDVYIRTIEFTNALDRESDADLVFRAFNDWDADGALSATNGWQTRALGEQVNLILEQHICDQDNEAGTFDALRAAFDSLQRDCRDAAGNERFPGACDCQRLEAAGKANECEIGQRLGDRCRCGHRAPFGIAHELGHYLFGLDDEYRGTLWQNCNTANTDCPSCTIQPNSKNDRGQQIGFVGSFEFNLAPFETVYRSVQLVQEAREIVLTLDLDAAQFKNGTASGKVDFEILKPGGAQADDDTTEGTTISFEIPKKYDDAGNRISACDRGNGVKQESTAGMRTEEGAQTFEFSDGSTQKLWTITNPGGGLWRGVIRSKSATTQTVTFAYRVDYKCSFRCAARTTDGAGSCASTTEAANEACVMDGGTTMADRNRRTEYCTKHGVDVSTGHDAGLQQNDLSDSCNVVFFVNAQEQSTSKSCWKSLSQGKFRKKKILGMTGFFVDSTPVTDTLLKARAESLGTHGKEIVQLLRERTVTATQTLPQELLPMFISTELNPCSAAVEPVGDGTVLGALHSTNREYVTGPPGFVVCIDTSRSMGDEITLDDGTTVRKLDLAVQAARDSINLLKDPEQYAVLAFADDITTVRALGTAEDSREGFVAAATNSTTLFELGDRTAMGECLAAAHDVLGDLTGDAMSGKTIVIVSDGRSNIGRSVESMLETLAQTRRLTVHTVGLGAQADVETLEELARRTGGSFWFAADARDIGAIMPRIFAAARGEDELWVTTKVVAARGSDATPVDINPFLDDVTFLLASSEAERLTFTVENDPGDGSSVKVYGKGDHDPVAGIEFRTEQTQQYLRLRDPQGGTWTLKVSNDLGESVAYRLQVLGGSSRLSIRTAVRSDGPVESPAPIVVETIVAAPGRLTGIEVSLVVTHPGPGKNRSELTMRDDGSIESGDRKAGDGIYTAMFSEYAAKDGAGNGGDGPYVINVTAENVVTPDSSGRQVPADDGVALRPSIPVREPFTVLDETCALVRGIPTQLREGVAVLERVVSALPATRAVKDLEVTPVFTFSLRGVDEWLLLESLTLDLTVPNVDPAVGVERLEMVALYLDEDKDFVVDNRYRPLSWGRFELVEETALVKNYQVTFDLGRESETNRRRFLWLLRTGETHQFLVTLGQPRPRGVAPSFTFGTIKPRLPAGGTAGASVPPPPGFLLGLAGLAFVLLLASYRLGAPRLARQVATAGFAGMLFVLFLAIGCGGGGGGPETPHLPTPTPLPVYTGPLKHEPRPEVAGRYEFTLLPGQVSFLSHRGGESGEAARRRPTHGGAVASVVVLEN